LSVDPYVLDSEALAELHRPHDKATLRAAAVELRSRGLTYRDISEALGLTVWAVAQLLRHEKDTA